MSNASPLRRTFREITAHDKPSARSSQASRPTLLDLLVGAPFADGSHEADADTLAQWLLQHTDAASIPNLHRDLHLLACAQNAASLTTASATCREYAADAVEDAELFAEAAGLFDYYAACAGDADAALRIAACAVSTIGHPGINDRTALERGLAALGWLWFAGSDADCNGTEPVRQSVLYAAEDILDRMTEGRRAPRRRSALAQPPSEETSTVFASMHPTFADNPSDEDGDAEHGGTRGRVVVLRSIGNPDTAEGKRLVGAYRGLAGVPLPLAPTPDLKALHLGLLEEYPHARAAIDAIVGELVGKDHVALPPVVLVGEPGVGKTQLAGAVPCAKSRTAPC